MCRTLRLQTKNTYVSIGYKESCEVEKTVHKKGHLYLFLLNCAIFSFQARMIITISKFFLSHWRLVLSPWARVIFQYILRCCFLLMPRHFFFAWTSFILCNTYTTHCYNIHMWNLIRIAKLLDLLFEYIFSESVCPSLVSFTVYFILNFDNV